MNFPVFGELIEEETKPQDFEIFGELIEEKPSIPSEIGRHTARTASRVGETILGLPGDITRAAGLGAKGLEKVASGVREKIGLTPIKSTERPPGIFGSQELREFSKKVFGDIVEPQSKKEKFIDDIVSDATALAIPLKGKIPFLRSIGTAIAGNLSSEIAEKFGAQEKGKTAAKLGTFFLSGLTGKGNLKKFWNEQYRLADESVPSKTRLNANKLDRKLDKLSKDLRKGGIVTPSEKFVQKPLKELKRIIHDGELRVEDAVNAKKKINELRSSLFDEVKGKSAQKFARTRINDISNYLDETLALYGKENPTFIKHYKAANEAYGGYQQSKRVGNWISRAIPFGNFGKGSLLIAEAIFKPASLKATVPAWGLFKMGELVTRMTKNPTLRNYYVNLIKNAINENKSGFIKNLKGMENEVKKNEPDLFQNID